MIGFFPPDKRVIALHDIDNAGLFAEKMVWLASRYEILPLDRLFLVPQARRTQVAITFDDGDATQYERAVPILRSLRLPATFFLCSGFIGLVEDEVRDFVCRRLRRTRILRPLTVLQARAMAHDPLFTIGSYTSRHADLGAVPPHEAIEIAMADKRSLEAMIGTSVRWFAYPFGRRSSIPNPPIGRALLAGGFSGACTIIPGPADGDDMSEIPRSCLDIHSSSFRWRLSLGRTYDWMRYVRD